MTVMVLAGIPPTYILAGERLRFDARRGAIVNMGISLTKEEETLEADERFFGPTPPRVRGPDD